MRFVIILIPVLLVMFGVFYAGMVAGRNKDKARDTQYKVANANLSDAVEDNLRLLRQNEEYSAALRSISAGRGASPEITAASALAAAKNYELG